MTISVLLALSVTTYICSGSRSTTTDDKFRIYGGQFTEVESVPYLAQILQHGSYLCGASIISRYWLLTAAHCIKNHGDGFFIMTGSKHPQSGGTLYPVSEIIAHALYDPEECEHDIALIGVEGPIKFGPKQRPIRIISRAPRVGEIARVSGFGKEGESGELSSTVKTAEIPVVNPRECEVTYSTKIITKKILCMGWMQKGQPDTCQGDSGSPAVIDDALAGIVSSGRICETSEAPGIYTMVYEYRDWIKANTGVMLEGIS